MGEAMVREIGEVDFGRVVIGAAGAVVVEFFATWCGSCRRLATLDRLAGEFADRAEFVKVNVDESPKLVARYGVASTPTRVVFDAGAPVGDPLVGAHSEDRVREMITGALPHRLAAPTPAPGRDGLLAWVPADACTLPTAEQPLRVAEFYDLFAGSLRAVDRVSPTRLRLRIDAMAEDRARDLAQRENTCCSFFTFGFTPAAEGAVWMDIGVTAERAGVLDDLAAQAARAGARR